MFNALLIKTHFAYEDWSNFVFIIEILKYIKIN
jgi:hypothetical protein